MSRISSPRVELKMDKLNPTYFLVNQKYCHPARPITGWWVSELTHLRFFFYNLFLYIDYITMIVN